jgi:hypothetical protein
LSPDGTGIGASPGPLRAIRKDNRPSMMLRSFLLLFGVALLGFAVHSTALAHAEPERSNPAASVLTVAAIASSDGPAEALPSSGAKSAHVLAQTTPDKEPAKPDIRALAIALGVGAAAAALIYGFWRLVKPRK